MRLKALTLAVLGIVSALAACSGNRFGSDDPPAARPDHTGGTSNHAGKSGSGTAEPGEGGEASTTGGKANGNGGQGGSVGGRSSTVGGSPAGGGTSPGMGGSNDGAAGEDGGPVEPVFTMAKFIDNMEDGNATLLESNGDWFVFHDTTNGTMTPAKNQVFTMATLAPVRGESEKAVEVRVSGFTDWGAAFGFDFSYAAGVRQPTDLKEALAVRFWAKASKATTVEFQMPNADTDAQGGKCNGTGNDACNAHWSKAFNVGTAWKETTIVFADLRQRLPGRHVPTFDKQHVYSTFFVTGPNQTVTVWIDDIALVH